MSKSGDKRQFSSQPDVALRRSLSCYQGVSIIIGVMVGSGVYATPQDVMGFAGSAAVSLMLWFGAGIFSLMGAICFTEIGIQYQVAGEKYAYLKILYGNYMAFTFVWQYVFLIRPGSNAIKVLVLSRHLLKPLFLLCALPATSVNLISTVFAVFISFLNSTSTKMAVKCQEFMTGVTLTTLGLIAGVGLYEILRGDGERTLDVLLKISSTSFETIIMGFYPAVYAYYGWSTLNFLIEELKDPYRNLPKAVIFSMSILMLLYFLVNFSYFIVLEEDGVLRSEAVAINFAMKTFGQAGLFISAFIALTACSGYNSGILIGSRVALAGARNGHLPWMFSFISLTYVTPIVSIIFQCLLTLIYIWVLDAAAIIQNVVYSYLIFDLLVSLGYIRVRFMSGSKKHIHFKVPILIHFVYCAILGFLVITPLAKDVGKSPKGFLIAAGISLIFYYTFITNTSTGVWTTRLLKMKEEKRMSISTCESLLTSDPSLSNTRNRLKAEAGNVRLKRQLGILYGIVIIIGLTVGGGIYISPQTVLRNAGSPGLTLAVWILGGLNALFGALVFAEIGIHIPVAGEGYPYLCELYNPYIGFMYVWQYLLLVRPGSNALKMIIFSRYLLKPLYQQCEIPRTAMMLLATAMSTLITALNCMNLKLLARGQSLMSAISVGTLSMLAALGLYMIFTGHHENLENPFEDSTASPGNFVLALYATMFAYNGWSALNFIIEEIRNPNRTLPIAIIISSILLTTLYTLVNLTYLVVLGKEEALSSEAVAISAIMKVSSVGGWIMSVLIAVTAISSCNSGHLIASRLAFSASRNGHLPAALAFISVTQVTPIVSVIYIGMMVALFIWAFDVEFLLINVMFSGILGDFLVSLGYLKRRLTTRTSAMDNDGKLKVPLAVHVVYAASLFIFTVVPLVTNPVESAAGCSFVILTSTLYYVAFVKFKVASDWAFVGRTNTFLQKLFSCAPADKNH